MMGDVVFGPKIKDCQVLATRISRELGGKDDITALEVGAVNEKDLEKVKTDNCLD